MRFLIASVFLLSCLTACTVWEMQEATPKQLLAREPPPDRVRVTLSETGYSWVILKEPRISGDSLIGMVYDGSYRGQRLAGGQATGIRLDDIVRVEVAAEHQGSPAGALFAGAGIGALLNGLANAMIQNAFKGWGPP
jgi:hypothetical protein